MPSFSKLTIDEIRSLAEEKREAFITSIYEDGVAANCAGGGNVAGMGVGPNGEPGMKKKRKTATNGGNNAAN